MRNRSQLTDKLFRMLSVECEVREVIKRNQYENKINEMGFDRMGQPIYKYDSKKKDD